MKSKITSIFGVISAAGAVCLAFDMPEIAAWLLAIGTGGGGVAARDNNRSSESVGAR